MTETLLELVYGLPLIENVFTCMFGSHIKLEQSSRAAEVVEISTLFK